MTRGTTHPITGTQSAYYFFWLKVRLELSTLRRNGILLKPY
jgi:hypothetical protein